MSLQGLKQKKTLQLHHTGSDLLAREGRLLMKATSQTPTVLEYGLRQSRASVFSDLAWKVTK